MKRDRFLVVVMVLALIAMVIGGESAQTQAPAGTAPPAAEFGTAQTGRERTGDLVDGPSGLELDPAPDPAQSYNASLRIPAAALKPRRSDVEWQAGGEGGCVYATSGDQWTWWAAPLYLPHGSILRYFRMYYNDQNTEADCAAFLTVYDLYGRIVTEWGINSTSTGQTYATTAELDHIIDYDYYSYVIHWRPNVIGDTMQVCGFKVYYHTTWGVLFMPNVMNGN